MLIRGPGVPLPLLAAAARLRLAAELCSEADLPPFADPRHLAVRLGMALGLRGRAHESTTASVVMFEWLTDRREQGEHVHAELAAAYLLRRGIAHTASDVRLLSLDVALPASERGIGLARSIWAQRHLTTPSIQAVFARLRARV